MTKAILTCFHKYQPYGGEFYQPILDFYVKTMKKYENEYDNIYLIDSNWTIDNWAIEQIGLKYQKIEVNPSLRYYDAYKTVLPYVKEDAVLLIDDDMVVYKKGMISGAFYELEREYDVVSIYDTIGEYQTGKLNGKNKFCPYWFCAKKDTLMKYLDIDWASHMPHSETLGYLTEKMVNDELRAYEFEEDKSNILYTGIKDGEKGKNLGYYHIRAGSTPAYLLAEKNYGNPTVYWDYIEKQPKTEYIRQCAWYKYMGGEPKAIINDCGVYQLFEEYYQKFLEYHGL